jgi:hypothetical protein
MATTRPADDAAAKNAQGPLYAGIDVGGTNIKIGLVDDHGATVALLLFLSLLLRVG